MSSLLTYNGFDMEYFEFGSGSEILFAFPGFNRSAYDFKILEPSLGMHYKIISFNVLQHINKHTKKGPENALAKSDLKGLIDVYLRKSGIKHFSLMGYSLGGRMALSCIELFPGQVKSIYLFAPDGIKVNKWYNLVSKSKLGWKLSEYLVNKPGLFFKLSLFLKNMGLLSKRLYNFSNYHMASQSQRKKVYEIWLSLRKIFPNIPKVQDLINHYHIKTHLFFGTYDVVIPPSIGRKFMLTLNDQSGLYIVPMGHNLIAEEMNGYIDKILK